MLPQKLTPPPIKEVDVQLSETDHIEPDSQSIKRYKAGSERFKMRAVSAQVDTQQSNTIPMMLTTAPSAVTQEQHYEVIKPTEPEKTPTFSLQDTPEVIARGERYWKSAQPQYIDFAPYFSLDSLIDMTIIADKKV